jgi:hypothetical protein
MSLSKREPTGKKEPTPSFHWTEDTVAQFRRTFHETDGVQRLDLPTHLTHQCVERTSRGLSTRSFSIRTDQRYFGWFDTHLAWNDCHVSRLPIQLIVEERPKVAYVRQSSEDWGSLTRLGYAYLWSRGEDSRDATHGIEALLFLDTRRYRAFRQAVRAHRGATPPSITLGLRQRNDEDSEDDNRLGERSPRFDIVAYWLTTWPMWCGPASDHPWAADADS